MSTACLVVAFSRTARADTILAFDADYVTPVDEAQVAPGFGLSVRGGPRLDLKVLTLTSELVGQFREFGGVADPIIYEGKVGTRLGIGGILRPSAFLHIGVGHVDFASVYDDHTGFAADLGLALDLTVLPVINLGAQTAVNALTGDPALHWINVGGHVTFVFD